MHDEKLTKKIEKIAKKEKCVGLFNEIVQSNENKKIKVPLVGVFSSGKSSLINKIIRDDLLSVEVTEETFIPTEVHYNESSESFLVKCNSGKQKALSREKLKDERYLNKITEFLSYSDDEPCFWIEATTCCKNNIINKDLAVVDMPGWGTNYPDREKSIKKYLSDCEALGIVVNADAGAINNELKSRLCEINIKEKEIILIINKKDKINENEIDDVVTKVKSGIESIEGAHVVKSAVVSARKKELDGLEGAFKALAENVKKRRHINYLERCQAFLSFVLEKDVSSEKITIDRATIGRYIKEQEGLASYELINKMIDKIKGNQKNRSFFWRIIDMMGFHGKGYEYVNLNSDEEVIKKLANERNEQLESIFDCFNKKTIEKYGKDELRELLDDLENKFFFYSAKDKKEFEKIIKDALEVIKENIDTDNDLMPSNVDDLIDIRKPGEVVREFLLDHVRSNKIRINKFVEPVYSEISDGGKEVVTAEDEIDSRKAEKKANNAVRSFAYQCDSDRGFYSVDGLVLFDLTAFGSGKDGIFFGENHIAIKPGFSKRDFYYINDIRRIRVDRDDKEIVINSDYHKYYSKSITRKLEKVVNCYQQYFEQPAIKLENMINEALTESAVEDYLNGK